MDNTQETKTDLYKIKKLVGSSEPARPTSHKNKAINMGMLNACKLI